MKSYIKESIDKVIGEEKIYKEIDFEKDICKEKSDLYFINDDGELQFICGSPKSLLDYDGYFFDNPQDCRPRTSLEFKPIKVIFNDTIVQYRANYISNYLIDSDDVIYFKFKNSNLSKEQIFYFCLQDNIFLEANKRTIIDNSMIKDGEYFAFSLNSTAVNSIYINKKSDSSLIYTRNINTDMNTYILDTSQNKIYINGYVINQFNNLDFKNKLNNICLTYVQTILKDETININHNDVIIGRRKGMVYLNPIKFNTSVRLKMIYRGNINIELYSHKKNRWIKLRKEEILENEKFLNLRVVFSTGDKLAKLSFVSIEY